MIGIAASKFSKILVKKDIVQFDDYEQCILGFEIILTAVFQLGALIILGTFLGYFWETIIFLLFFSTLRAYAGGFHASSILKCSGLMALFIIVSIYVSINVAASNNSLTLIFINLISFMIIIYFKSFSELRVFKRSREFRMSKYLIVFLAEFLVILLVSFIVPELIQLCTIATMGILLESITLININQLGGFRNEENR